MRIRLFTSVATCVLALELTGCRVQSTLLTPTLAPLPYATQGEILEFRASSPKAPTTYIVFFGNSPCAEPYYTIEPNKPARCKILKGRSGYFEYYFQTEKPAPQKFFARSCQYCQVISVGPVNNGSAGSSQTGESNDSNKSNESKTGSATSAGAGHPYPPLPVSCDDDLGKAAVDNTLVQNGVQTQDKISWIPMNPAQTVTVTTPSGMCSGGQAGVFTAQDACTVTGTPGKYSYTVQLDQCAGQGSSTLTINPTPPAQ
jgi:hypothetical protein